MPAISTEIVDGIATVTLDRPPVNALDGPMMAELQTAFESFENDRAVRVAVLTARGDRAFSAGIDLKSIDLITEARQPSEIVDPGARARAAMWSIVDCAVPVIAAVNGPAIGAGLAFAACCDIILAAEGVTFGVTEINAGLLGASAHVSSLVGRHKAREMFFTGELVSAETLERLGAIRAVVPREQLCQVAMDLAALLAAKSPLGLRMAKRSMNHVEGLPLRQAYRIEQFYTESLLRFDDSAEARRAFFEKRSANWQWR